jgi:uncharacterized membrane protein
MGVDEIFYELGERVEWNMRKVAGSLRDFFFPQPSLNPPSFGFLRRFVKRDVTIHELLSLRLQLIFIVYLGLSFGVLFLHWGLFSLFLLYLAAFLFIRWTVQKYREFFIEFEPYRFFYYWITTISFVAFTGYLLLRRYANSIYHYYAYILGVFLAVLIFRWYFKRRFGRDYTYGVVEDVKNGLIRVFVHDDIAANIKPGHYWVPAVPEAEPGRVVKLLIEDRPLKGAVPVRVLEVYLGSQSSQISIDPNEQTE